MNELIRSISFALSDIAELKERARKTLKSMNINRSVLDRLVEGKEHLGESWCVAVKPVGEDLLMRVYREVEYDAGHIGTYDSDEGEMYLLFRRSGGVTVGTEETFKKELEQ